MEKTREVRIILLIIISVWIFQSSPSAINCVDGFYNQTQNSKVYFSSNINDADILYIDRVSIKSPILKLNTNNTTYYFNKTYTNDFISGNYTSYELLLDHRNIIRQFIPHYFNGNKYT